MKLLRPAYNHVEGNKVWNGYLFDVDALYPSAFPGDTVTHESLEIYEQIRNMPETTGISSAGHTCEFVTQGHTYTIVVKKHKATCKATIQNTFDPCDKIVLKGDQGIRELWERISHLVKTRMDFVQLRLFSEEQL